MAEHFRNPDFGKRNTDADVLSAALREIYIEITAA